MTPKVIGKVAKIDIDLIKINASNSFPVADLGDSDKLRVGEWVLRLSETLSVLEQTVTQGIVSAKGRVIGSGPYD